MGPSPTCHPPEGEECKTSVEHGLPLWAEPAVEYCSRRPRPSPMWGSRFVGARAVGPWVGEQKPFGKTPRRGNPSPESTYLPTSWLWAFEKMFHTRIPDTELTKKIEDMHRTCKECVTSKRNRPSDRRLLGVLPIPHMVNALLYVEFIDRPKCHNYEYALMIVDALSAFCQVVPCKKTIDGEGVLKLIKHHWICFYGLRFRIHSDKDIRFKGDYGCYRNVFAAMGMEVSFSQPYRPQSNGLCEFMNDEYQEEVRILRQSTETSNWVQLNNYVVICMNHKQRGKSGYSRGDVFRGRPTLRLDLPFPHKGNI